MCTTTPTNPGSCKYRLFGDLRPAARRHFRVAPKRPRSFITPDGAPGLDKQMIAASDSSWQPALAR